MATREECLAALQGLAARLATVDDDVRRKHSVDRTLSCTVSDLGATFVGRLQDGALVDVREEDSPAQIRLQVDSDDLIALVGGSLNFASAWAKGRLRVEASVLDLLRLRTLL
jgi:predicted lipid carrier protein YhbT